MDHIDAFEELLAADPYGKLRVELAENDDQMLEQLVLLRRRKDLTQDDVAKRMGRSKTAVSNFERLGSDPHLSTIRRYAAAVGAGIRSHVTDFDQTFAWTDELEVRRSKPREARWTVDGDDESLNAEWAIN